MEFPKNIASKPPHLRVFNPSSTNAVVSLAGCGDFGAVGGDRGGAPPAEATRRDAAKDSIPY